MAERKYPFVQLDVFTARKLEGNPLAVFTDGRGLSDREMQQLAREMNLAETTFVLPGDRGAEARQGVRVRIFTVQEELPFAGHPTLGTAWLLRQERGGTADQIDLRLNVGKVPVAFSRRDGRLFGEMRQRDAEFGRVHSREEVARAAGLELGDLDPDLPIQTVSTGLVFAIVPIRRRETLRNWKFSFAHAASYLERSDAKFFYFVTLDVSGFDGEAAKARVHARMIFYNGEDPATGSAAGCCAAWMVKHGVAAPDEPALIAQGLEIGRPGFLHVRASKSGDAVTNVRVGGNVVEILRGEVVL
ncbi:MAG TPA: PhzF family phenazine biosynthesis protein [Terriglobales bacterium]|nr:PhzF family phenazine biosynthesis protein [Terriglobales bacterium]